MGGACILSAVEALPVLLSLGAMGGACLIAFQGLDGHTDETLGFIRAMDEAQQPDSQDLTCAPQGDHACFLSDAWALTGESLGATTAEDTSTVITIIMTKQAGLWC